MLNKKIIFSTRIISGDITPPSIPVGITTTDVVLNIINWDDSTDNVTPQNEIEYYLERADDITFSTNLTVVKNWAIIPGAFDDLTPIPIVGNTYYYRVKARDNALNESGWSEIKTSTIHVDADMLLDNANYTSGLNACNGSNIGVNPMWHNGTPGLPSVGDFVYQDAGYTAEFGGGDLWWYDSLNAISYQIKNTGEISTILTC